MPPLPTIADVFRVTLNWSNTVNHTHNVLHFKAPGKTVADLEGILDSHATNGMWGAMQSAWLVDSLDILPLDGTSGTSHFGSLTNDGRWSGSGGSPVAGRR